MAQLNEFGQPIGDALPRWRGATPPPGTVLTGAHVTLQPLTGEHAAALWTSLEEADDPTWTYLPVDRPTSLGDVETMVRGMLSAPTVPYAVVVGGTPRGVMSLMRIDPANGVIEIGHILFGPSLARTTAATEAHRLLMGHVFDLGYRRLEWKCDVLNAPSMSGARRLGYTYEGTFRNAIVTKGRSRDTAWWSMTDAEWPAARSRFDRWLEAANFDESGRQRARLGHA